MAKHKALKDAIREKAIRQQLEQSMREHYQRGLLVGTKAMLRVVADTIAEKDKTNEEKLAAIMSFCTNLLDMTKATDVGSADVKEQLDEVVGVAEESEEEQEETQEEAQEEKQEDSGTLEIPQPVEASDEV